MALIAYFMGGVQRITPGNKEPGRYGLEIGSLILTYETHENLAARRPMALITAATAHLVAGHRLIRVDAALLRPPLRVLRAVTLY